jgi:hypothetical protein
MTRVAALEWSTAIVLALTVAMPASAQKYGESPARFGPDPRGGAGVQAVDLTVGVGDRFDTRTAAGAEGQSPAFDAQGAYSRRGKRSVFGIVGSTSERFYRQQSGVAGNHEGGIHFETGSPRTRVSAAEMVRYSAYFSPDAPLSTAIAPEAIASAGGMDMGLARQSALIHVFHGEISQMLRRHSTLGFAYDERRTDFGGAAPDLTGHGVSGRFTQMVSRYATIRLGYGRESAVYRAATPGSTSIGNTKTDNLDIGVDYSRPLSFSRHTTFGIRTGSSIVSEQSRRYFRLTGEASANHQFSRDWAGRLFYRRGLQFLEGFPQPLFSDGLSTAVAGRFGRRVDAELSGGLSIGSVGAQAGAARYSSGSATALVRTVISRHLAFETQYSYSRYRFPAALQLPLGVDPALQRHSVQARVTVWAGARR